MREPAAVIKAREYGPETLSLGQLDKAMIWATSNDPALWSDLKDELDFREDPQEF